MVPVQRIEPVGNHDRVGEGVHVVRWRGSELGLVSRREAEPEFNAQFFEQPPHVHAEEATRCAACHAEAATAPSGRRHRAIDCRQIVKLFVSALVLEAPECAAPLLAR
jgi:hypothetical protein